LIALSTLIHCPHLIYKGLIYCLLNPGAIRAEFSTSVLMNLLSLGHRYSSDAGCPLRKIFWVYSYCFYLNVLLCVWSLTKGFQRDTRMMVWRGNIRDNTINDNVIYNVSFSPHHPCWWSLICYSLRPISDKFWASPSLYSNILDYNSVNVKENKVNYRENKLKLQGNVSQK
jgi:hypothetical protein